MESILFSGFLSSAHSHTAHIDNLCSDALVIFVHTGRSSMVKVTFIVDVAPRAKSPRSQNISPFIGSILVGVRSALSNVINDGSK